MSRTYHHRRGSNTRKFVRNKYLQYMCMEYSDDFKGKKGKHRWITKPIRKREKENLRKEISDGQQNY